MYVELQRDYKSSKNDFTLLGQTVKPDINFDRKIRTYK
jgi:hypothetical protein